MGMASKRNPTVRVTLVSGNRLARVGLRRLLETNLGILLVGESYGGIHACGLLQQEHPDCVIVDLESEMNITEAVESYKQIAPNAKILLLSGWNDVDRARQALGIGAEGIILKCQPPSVLMAMIEGRTEELAVEMIAPAAQAQAPATGTEGKNPVKRVPVELGRGTGQLTDRERAVVRLVGQGLSNRDIADRLCISETTVRHHLTSIFDKMGVSNRQKLLIRAHQDGLVELTASA